MGQDPSPLGTEDEWSVEWVGPTLRVPFLTFTVTGVLTRLQLTLSHRMSH